MERFTTLTGISAPLPMINVDTDKIIPKQYLKTIRRTGLGRHLFDEMRHDAQGRERPEFILNRDPWRKASILVTEDNFGCGSSREHAPWALLDFGIRCVIAPSFAEIFFGNCVNNGILAITMEHEDVRRLMDDARAGHNARLTVDLESQTVTRPDGSRIAFTIDGSVKHRLLNGLDPIGISLSREADITAFEERRAALQPWL